MIADNNIRKKAIEAVRNRYIKPKIKVKKPVGKCIVCENSLTKFVPKMSAKYENEIIFWCVDCWNKTLKESK